MNPTGILLVVVACAGAATAVRAVAAAHRARHRLAATADGRRNGHGPPGATTPPAGHTSSPFVDPRHPSVQGRGPTPSRRPRGHLQPVDDVGTGASFPATGPSAPTPARLPGGASSGDGRTSGRDRATTGGWALGHLWRRVGSRPGHADVAGPVVDGPWGGFAPPGDASTAGRGSGGERPPAAVLAAGVGLVAAVVIVAGPAAALLVVGAATVGAVWARRRQRVAWRRRRQGQLPVALERLASALRGGASVPGALTVVGDGLPAPLGPELSALGHEADAGRAVTDVLDEWAAIHGDAGTRLAATALVLAAAVGAAPARAADGVAATLRERADLAAERRALGAQARMSAAVLSIAPVGFAAFLGTTDAAATRFLLGTPAGWACLAVGLSLDAAGAWWMARATRGDER